MHTRSLALLTLRRTSIFRQQFTTTAFAMPNRVTRSYSGSKADTGMSLEYEEAGREVVVDVDGKEPKAEDGGAKKDEVDDDMSALLESTLSMHQPRKYQTPGLADREFRFKCTGCGKCCTGEPGNVFITDGDISRMAKKLGMSEKRFMKHHTRLTYDPDTKMRRYSLRETPSMTRPGDMNCEFLDDLTFRCRLYEVRPLQCRTYPFWPEIVESKHAWEGTSTSCRATRMPFIFH